MSRVAELNKIFGLCLLLGLIDPIPALADSLSIRVGQGNDDAEETVSNGNMLLTSSDLELINDAAAHGGDQLVGIRFLNVNIPAGATINSAYIDFIVDETSSTATSVTFRGEDSDNPNIFTTAAYNISNRTPTTAAVAWNNIPAWNTVGTTQTTPDLTAIVQEVVDRGGWSSGNAMVFIVTGSGQRTAESYNGVPGSAPLLRVDYTLVDSVPPAAVTDLAAGSSTSSSVMLTWTAPGDDGSSGTAATYDIRYSTSPINAGNWDFASPATGEPAPQSAGSSESFIVTGLSRSTTYYFALKTADEVPLWSGLSNLPSGSTTAGTNSNGDCGVLYEEFSEAKSNDNVTSITVLKPAGTSYGHLLIAAVALEKGQQSSLSAPAGWSTINVNENEDKITLGVWYKIAGAVEPASYRFTWSDDVQAYAWIMRFTGHDMTTPINTWAGREGKSEWPTSPSVTTTVENTVILRLGAFEDDEIIVDNPGLAGHTPITMDSDNDEGKASGGAGYIDQAAIGASGTSSFTLTGEKEYRNVTVAIAPDPDCFPGINGTIWEDLNGDAGLSDGVGSPNVMVKLYSDGGDGLPNGSDDFLVGTTATQADGSYVFNPPSDGNYWVVVDSKTITPADGYNGSFSLSDVWAEQTYGPAGGLIDDGAGGTIERVTPGPSYGGRDTERSDDASALGTAEHVAKVAVIGGGVSNVDFGFSFNAIVQTGDGDDDLTANRNVQGSLRQFLQNSNAIFGTNASYFAIPTHDSGYNPSGFGEFRIQPASALPTLTNPLVLNGTTQSGFVDQPLIEIDGSSAGAGINGLTISAGNSTVRGLVINRFNGSAIQLLKLGGNTIAGNFIGPDAGGMTGGVGNFVEGIYIYESPNNVIGGTQNTDRNVISGNRLRGIWINEVDDGPAASSSGTQILGNFIGTNADGTGRLPYSGGGSPAYQQIGIAFWDAIGNTIGGNALGSGNVISGNSWYGIYFWGSNSDNNAIHGNIIGLNAAQTVSVGNGFEGASRAGVYISNAPGNAVGGTGPGQGNVIAGNAAHGVVIYGANATGNIIAGNSIHDNAGLGIDLDLDGVTPNDPDDGDTGGNSLLNYPVLTSAVSGGGNITVQGYLTSIPNTNFRILFYSNSVADPSGYGEGETYIGAAMVSTDGSGHAPIDHTMPGSLPTGFVIAATTTDPVFNTSEFSAGVVVVGTADVSLTKSDSDDPVATGGALLYTLLVTNNGPDTATGVTVVDNLPGGVTLQSVTVSQGTWSGTSEITCNLGAILNGGTATVEILVIPSGTGTILNTAQVTTNDIDNVPGNDSDSETTEVVAEGTTDVPLTLYQRIHGFVDFTTTGGTLRTEPNGVDPCAVTGTSAATLAGIPPTGTVSAAYLYWAASGSTVDASVTLDGGGLTADRSWQSTFVLGATSFDFFGCFKDVTTEVQTKGNGLYTFSGLTIDSGSPYCGSAAVLGGWSLIVIYEDLSLSGKTLVVYDGFDLERNGSTSYLLSGIYAADPPEAKTALLVWEGDDTLGGVTESLEFNGTPQSDLLNPVNNVYNGTINTLGVNNSYGLDLDTFDVSGLVNFGDTFATTTLLTGPDLVILNAVVLEAKTNVIAGAVFEDVNYGGGPGRNLVAAVADAPSFSVGRPNVTVELYDAAGNYFRSTTTSSSGAYGFTGLADGNYFVRVVNGTVTSSRNGATGAEWAIQTYRTDASSGNSVAVTNEIGGTDPTVQDDPVNGSSADLEDITAQSVTPVLLSNSLSVISVDFGFNFDTIVNTNDSDQGSLRQVILNSNALQNTDLDQDGLTPDIETIIFQIPTTDPFYNRTGNGEFSILPDTPLDAVTDPVIISGATQPGFAGTPIIELDGTNAGAGAAGLTFTAGGSTVQSLAINRYTNGIILNGGDASTILSCYIGTDVTGSVDHGNSERGVWIRSGTDDTVIGGTVAGSGNLIAFSGTDGIGLEAGAGTGNAILGNSIHDSGDLAIDLTENGFTDNDPLDADLGENNLQNFPVVTFAQFDGANLIIRGSLSSEANTTYRVEFFANQTVDPSGYGEGETYLIHTDLTTDGSGDASFDLSFPLAATLGYYISATATDPGNSTSEFGDNTIVLGMPDVLLVKSVVTLNDPVNGGTNPKAIPGAELLYTVAVTNEGGGPLDPNSVEIRDALPANTVLFVGDIDAPDSGPLLFENGTTASGLSYIFTALDSTTDNIQFSDDNATTYDYEPVPNVDGYDIRVTNWRVNPAGIFAPSDGSNHPSFSLKFKVRVN